MQLHRGFYLLFTMKPGRFYTPNTGNVMDGKAPVPGDTLPAPEAPGKESLPDGGGDGILEARNRDYKRDDKGRFAYSGGRKKQAKTKYAPSKQRNHKGVQLKPAEYSKLCSVFNTRYPGLMPQDGVKQVFTASHVYLAGADGYGGLTVYTKTKIKKGW